MKPNWQISRLKKNLLHNGCTIDYNCPEYEIPTATPLHLNIAGFCFSWCVSHRYRLCELQNVSITHFAISLRCTKEEEEGQKEEN